MRYQDMWVKGIGVPCLVLLMVHLGRDGNFFQWITNHNHYYYDLIFALLVTISVWEVTLLVIRGLDRKRPWKEGLGFRWIIQLSSTLILSTLIILVEGWLYALAIGGSLYHIVRWNIELPVSWLLIIGLNLIYFILYLIGKESSEEVRPVSLFGHSGLQTIPLALPEVAFFYSSNRMVYAQLEGGETVRTEYTLDWLEKQMLPEFFRLNRQFLTQKSAVGAFKVMPSRKLMITLRPPISQEVFVSQKKATAFKNWFKK